ncbi:MAG: VWA domain-containing protein [Acidobacteriaceae bacterium]|nr:VWA domain-containing protein [Acidobacteriaceae bacterium]
MKIATNRTHLSGARRAQALGAILLMLSSGMASAQQAAAPSGSTIHVTSRLVVLDVVVTDKKGQPIPDLTRDDFDIYEDNQPQSIRNFEQPSDHQLPDDAQTPEQAKAQVFDPAKPSTFGQSAVDILVLDQLNTHFADSSFAHRQMAEYLAKQPEALNHPTTLLMVYQDHFKLLQEFTRDRSKLEESLKKAPVSYSWELEMKGKADNGPITRLETSIRALQEMTQVYGRIPGRKNLIWLGAGFPSLDPESLTNTDYREVDDTIKHVTNEMLDARMTLYAIDPTSSAPPMTEITDFQQMAFAQLSGDLGSAPIDPVDSAAGFDTLSSVTGGRVIRNMNNITHQIEVSVNYADQFYTMSYSPTNKSDNALKFRKIRVVCKRPGTVVTTRKGYYGGNVPAYNAKHELSYDLSTAAASSQRLNGLNITVERNTSVAVLNDEWIIHVQAPGLTWQSMEDGSSKADVTVMAVSLDKKGRPLTHVAKNGSATARAGVNLRNEAKLANFDFTAEPAPKAVMLRFVVRDATNGKMGSFDVAITKK